MTGVGLRDSFWEEEMVVVNDRVFAEIDLLILAVLTPDLVLVLVGTRNAFTCTGMIKRKK